MVDALGIREEQVRLWPAAAAAVRLAGRLAKGERSAMKEMVEQARRAGKGSSAATAGGWDEARGEGEGMAEAAAEAKAALLSVLGEAGVLADASDDRWARASAEDCARMVCALGIEETDVSSHPMAVLALRVAERVLKGDVHALFDLVRAVSQRFASAISHALCGILDA